MNNYIVGRKPVLEALKHGVPIQKIFLAHGGHGEILQQLRYLAKQRGVPVSEVNKEKLHELSPETLHQGVIAITSTTREYEIENLLEIPVLKKEAPYFVILDGIEDPHNIGAIIRTAECAGVHGIILQKHHSPPLNETVIKASAGAALHLPIARVTNIAQTIDLLKQHGCWIVGTAVDAEKKYFELDFTMPLAIVIGSEGRGMRRLVKEQCDFLIRIPLRGSLDSLNASVASALVLFEVSRYRKTL
ncbi:MAG: 23S rRNA (guanosine(2251)-2'-O)-methyltransferase RlmB [bacterium]